MKRKMLAVFLTSALAMTMLVGCQKEKNVSNENVKKAEETLDFGTIKVGMDGAHAPYCSVNVDSGELEGFEVDVMNEISKREGIEMELEVASWEGIFGMLDSGQLTSIACSVEPNDERKEKYAFSDEYLQINKGFAIAKGSGANFKELKDLDNKKVGCRTGGNGVQQLEELMKQEGIEFEIVPYEGGGMDYDLSLGRIDAYYAPQISIQASADSGEFEIELSKIDPIFPAYCAYPFAKGGENTEKLIEVFDKALAEMKKDGTLEELSMKWFKLDATCQ